MSSDRLNQTQALRSSGRGLADRLMPPSPRLLVVRLALFILVPKRALHRTVTGYGKN